MASTVNKTLIESHWDSKFEVYEVKEFSDERGMVSETFRLDDDLTKDSKMCYISETEPFVIRGPHQHSNQTDNFVSWKNDMMYIMINPDNNEIRYFKTDPNKIYIVKVAPPIIHAYRNLSLSSMKTMNFPTSLFMGEDKKEEIDEIRHEDAIEDIRSIFVLGAKGRLGKEIITQLMDSSLGTDNRLKHHVIPIYEKIEPDCVPQILEHISKCNNPVIINCIANTKVTTESISSNDRQKYHDANSVIPERLLFQEELEKKIPVVQFSTDYVFKPEHEMFDYYTLSKNDFEKQVIEFGLEAHIIRLSNLFTMDNHDNFLAKVCNKILNKEKLSLYNNTKMTLTYVPQVAKIVVEMLQNGDFDEHKLEYYNIISDQSFTPYEIVQNHLKPYIDDITVEETKYSGTDWHDKYIKDVSSEKIVISFPSDIIDTCVQTFMNEQRRNYD